jgi:PilZ domain
LPIKCSKLQKAIPNWHFAVANSEYFYTLGAAPSQKVCICCRLLWDIEGIAIVQRAMQPNSQERRSMRRFDMRLPAIVKLEGASDLYTETQNVSARGVFFYLDSPVSSGTKLEVILTFPPHVTLTDAVRIRFAARVIRVETLLPSSRIGVAAMIEDYEFLRSSGSADFLTALQDEWKSTH